MITDIAEYKKLPQFGLNVSLVAACQRGNLEKVKFLLTSPELTTHANIHCNQDSPFRNALHSKELEIIKFFIIDMNIEKSKSIMGHLKARPNEAVEQMFAARELKKHLSNDLKNKSILNTKVKI